MRSRWTRWGFSLFLWLVLGYFGMQIVSTLTDSGLTATAYWYRAEQTVSVSGWVVREEQLLPRQEGVLELPLAEGERVGKGQVVACVYPSAKALQQVQELRDKQEQLSQLEQAEQSRLDANAALRIDSSLRQELLTLKQAQNRRDAAAMEQSTGTVQALTVRRSYAYGEEGLLQEQITQLRQEIQTLRSTAQTGQSAVYAQQSGLYSAVSDGYETVLTPETVCDLLPSELRRVQADTGTLSNVGRLIGGDCWYFAAVLPEEQAEQLGQLGTVTLRFAKGSDRDFTMQVEQIGKAEDGECVVLLSSRRYLAEVTLLRRQEADLILSSYEGLRIPANALQVTETAEDEPSGSSRETGVYCVSGMSAYFKPVQVLYLGEDYYLVKADSTVSGRILRAGDSVIVNAREMYDGKVVS